MDRLHILIYVLLGVVSFTHDWTSGSELERTVRPGENITLYCDCKLSTGVYIVWYRNCSHENQPSLVLDRNSYDLLIINITETDEGLYYCGTEQLKVEKEEHITRRHLYKYGNISTKIQFTVLDSSEPDHQETPQDCNGVCWMLLFSLCPAVAALSSLLSSLLVYHLCKKEEPQTDQQTPQTRQNQDEDVCYAAVEIRPASKRPKKKTTQSSDFSTYSSINTSRM
ncbi:Protein sidekick like [Dissostichus eleginoides]|uniref:Protein sidekick like n=1 Tax=Dissostichus eleginoides TaxID=100907 RepID=A0AAD9F1H8_DISEL|nr:Protein sidekick like [Dissostichus eleginoides]